MSKSREITEEELEDLATGAGVLGTGGGTHPYLELLNIRKLYREGKRVNMVEACDLADDDTVAVVPRTHRRGWQRRSQIII